MGSELLTSERFFVLEEGIAKSRYDADADSVEPVNRGPVARCSRCGGAIGMRMWLPPYRVDLELHGEEFGDLIKLPGDSILVSERFAQSFHAEKFTGLSGFHPVEVLRVRPRRRASKLSTIPSYLTVTAAMGRAALDLKRSRIQYIEQPTCDECRYGTQNGVHGFSLEEGTWQGEDIFRSRGLYGSLVVSARFERFVVKHGFTNMRLTPIEEYVWNPLGPEPLPHTKRGSA